MVQLDQHIVCVVMGQNCERFIEMCLESVKEADAIVFCDGGSTDKTMKIFKDFMHESRQVSYIEQEYNQEDKQMNGKQRNFYLDYVKKTYPDYWCLCLDADEVVEDFSKVREFINSTPEGIYSPKMRHFIGDLGHEDSTVDDHIVLNRLFKIKVADAYPLTEHPVLQAIPGTQYATTNSITIWHLAYVPNLWEIKRRYDGHIKKSEMHTKEYLDQWYRAHLFGSYPKKAIDLTNIPEVILKKFGIDKDEFYFANRVLETKHPIMIKQWKEYLKPNSVLDLGCGRGPYLYFWSWFVNKYKGIEISNYAVRKSFINNIVQGDISEEKEYFNAELITAIDVLEHLDKEKLDKTLKNMSIYGKTFLFSIPFKGDPNLSNDSTHIQFKTKDEWIKLIESHGIKIVETPKDWLFANQILVGTK